MKIRTCTKYIFISMKYWNERTPLQFVASCIWNTSEHFKISLGKYGSIVFGWMIGSKGRKM
ncbi:hypothetical protein Phi19:1_gp003 [Cellulophaga phage phi19:1]|uniref:Uncharacterized protein n=1 Tax=Cellulophaga phage phi19:1 TaxID=1327970 RepID=R9ZZA4_9CAUD|nr:hypothetical protein Phi19:1_gp003 [Cellulophaga phage phi19:1]AGO47293.1 hypothetical protein Phi19:1_gp003 [Cellulophaga phage phi19:1]